MDSFIGDGPRSYLARLPLCPPELTWEWYDWSDHGRWDPDDLQNFLWPLADRCLALGAAVVGVYVDGDGFTLGFIAADKVDRLLELAAIAEVRIYVHRTGAPLP
ncbi:hypothetical protein ACIRRA_34670 [Nocardia sp. NPDC101769]|uniref:DUF6630 family protein n=1 Tax=Nocardia sp. NPDC101769 TaxID=3364333 RepID=UPI00381EE446